MTNPRIYSYAEAVENIDFIFDSVVTTRQEIVIERPGKEDIAVLPASEVEAMQESLYLLSSFENASRLLTALHRARTESLPSQTIEELEAKLGLSS
ncbi:MAG: type II toxin-antitoxin system Phd/YefM family antitoxin [Cyanobacteria bacterium J007]|jgi:antitoxin YefM|nr:MAG: type II toxin-antitoxin system Phd/YefM family antitoxin [Cyanobacteria bacterium J007]